MARSRVLQVLIVMKLKQGKGFVQNM